MSVNNTLKGRMHKRGSVKSGKEVCKAPDINTWSKITGAFGKT
jgi:hypothetical protein